MCAVEEVWSHNPFCMKVWCMIFRIVSAEEFLTLFFHQPSCWSVHWYSRWYSSVSWSLLQWPWSSGYLYASIAWMLVEGNCSLSSLCTSCTKPKKGSGDCASTWCFASSDTFANPLPSFHSFFRCESHYVIQLSWRLTPPSDCYGIFSTELRWAAICGIRGRVIIGAHTDSWRGKQAIV